MTAKRFRELAIVSTGYRAGELPYWMITEAIAFNVDRDKGVEVLVSTESDLWSNFTRRPDMDYVIFEPEACPHRMPTAFDREVTIYWDALDGDDCYTIVGVAEAFNPLYLAPPVLPLA